ncbi:MAG: EpsI family protein [Desulfarculaceae bacterium]|nr:EpsI family protein [Desulfarculaceae bacterium]MCF8074015.1 EpsI family protein [Desulfarculaceae bacterium]MCF8102701.1 EpsI family protein [Desulfarculaceae bacterium]MCF8116058.1 EpsI family protein [Desulfarculaceae bacterium]
MISRRTKGLFIAAVLLVLAALFISVGQEVVPQKLQKPLGQIPLTLGSWRGIGADQKLDQGTLALLKPTDYLLRNYADPGGNLCAVFVAFFALQQEGQIIHSPRHCLPGNGWQISQRDEVKVSGPGGSWTVNHLILARNLDKLSVLYWYQGRGRVEADEYEDRIRLVLDGIVRNRNDGALVRLTMGTPRGVPYALRLQKQLAARLIPALQKILPSS